MSTDSPQAARDSTVAATVRWHAPALAAVLVVALVLRIPAVFGEIGWGARDELMYVSKAVRYGGGDLNPHYFQNPPLAGYLMFPGIALRYLWGRMTGEYAGSLDFKAAYLIGAPGAFVAARAVSVVIGLAAIVLLDRLARRLVPPGVSEPVRRLAGITAAVGLATSPLHVDRASLATNEALVLLAFTAAILAAIRLGELGTRRAAIVAGAVAGISAGAKYTGVVACVPVGLAALLAAGRTPRERVSLCVAAAIASLAGFLVTCPWVVLDAATFRSHLENLWITKDRWEDGRSWSRYAETAWTEGLLPWWSLAAIGALVVAAVGRFAGATRSAVIAIAGILALAFVLGSHDQMAYGRYLMPAYPSAIALAAAAATTFAGRGATWFRGWFLILAVAGGAYQHLDLGARYREMRLPSTRDDVAAWLHANVPDGAHVVGDWALPPLPEIAGRREFAGRVAPQIEAAYTPAFRVTTAYSYFALPVNALGGTGVPVDDLPALRAHAPVWFVLSSGCEGTFDRLRPSDYPPLRWYRAVRAELRLVHSIRAGATRRGTDYDVYVLE